MYLPNFRAQNSSPSFGEFGFFLYLRSKILKTKDYEEKVFILDNGRRDGLRRQLSRLSPDRRNGDSKDIREGGRGAGDDVRGFFP